MYILNQLSLCWKCHRPFLSEREMCIGFVNGEARDMPADLRSGSQPLERRESHFSLRDGLPG